MVDYHLLSAMDMLRNFEVIHHDVASRHTPLGSKGKGQGAPGMVLAALANAIEDALTPFGVKITELLLMEYIWRLLHPDKAAEV
jgi:carbon-monoxide dehydrogenase large subunit